MSEVSALPSSANVLGETPLWCSAQNLLWWIDIRAPALMAFDPENVSVKRWPMHEVICGIALRRGGGLVVALKDALYGFDPVAGLSKTLVTVERDLPQNRLNDVRCDRNGNLWVGSMWDYGKGVSGALYRIDSYFNVLCVRTEVRIPNALAVSPDGTILYFADTSTGTIEQTRLDPETGLPGTWEHFAHAQSAPGRPDGATIDAEGFLWNARQDGACLARFAPDGQLDRIVALPVSKPTACAFGGSDHMTLYVTSATQGMSQTQLSSEPLAGRLLSLRPGVAGLLDAEFDV